MNKENIKREQEDDDRVFRLESARVKIMRITTSAKMLIAVGSLALLGASYSFISNEIGRQFFGENFILFIFPVVALTAAVLFRYLQGDTKTKQNIGNADLARVYRLVQELSERTLTRKQWHQINNDISEIKQSFKNESTGLGMEPFQRDELVELVKRKITNTVSDDFLTALDEKYAPAVVKKHEFTRLLDDFSSLIDRLDGEKNVLSRRANSNLSIGSVLTFAAMASLTYVVMSASVDYKDMTEVLAYYIPRLAFIVFIEIFAYFFLKLYKANLADIKYYNNELTNVESKIIALKSGLLLEDDTSIKAIIENLSNTERNFVLQKGETTVEIEKSRIEVDQLREILNLGGVLSKLKKSK